MTKLLIDDPYYGPKIKALEEEALAGTECAMKQVAGLGDSLKATFEKKINQVTKARINQFKKKYGRSKYVPH